MRLPASLWRLIGLLLVVGDYAASAASTNNWAVIVSGSTFWFNYRHQANAMGMYRTVKRLGVPDERIILMLADDAACNPRNMFAGTIYSNANRALDLYGDAVEVDYRGDEVTVENFIRLMTGRVDPHTPLNKRLNTDERSNIFVYMTGHGGDEFLKFQDSEEVSAFDLADAFQQMWTKKRYNEILFMVDTCQANTLYTQFYSPNIIATGCSAKDENSYSHHADQDVGVAVIDRYTHFVLNFLEGLNKTSQTKLLDLFNAYSFDEVHSNPGVRTDLFRSRPLESVLLTDFFGGVSQVEVMDGPRSVDDEGLSTKVQKAPIERPQGVTTHRSPAFRLHLREVHTDTAWTSSMLLGGLLLLAPLGAHMLSRLGS